jgi:hypothetical protein
MPERKGQKTRAFDSRHDGAVSRRSIANRLRRSWLRARGALGLATHLLRVGHHGVFAHGHVKASRTTRAATSGAARDAFVIRCACRRGVGREIHRGALPSAACGMEPWVGCHGARRTRHDWTRANPFRQLGRMPTHHRRVVARGRHTAWRTTGERHHLTVARCRTRLPSLGCLGGPTVCACGHRRPCRSVREVGN